MSKKKTTSKKTGSKKANQRINPLMLVAAAVAVLAIILVFFSPENITSNTGKKSPEKESSDDSGVSEVNLNEDGDVVIPVADITEEASFYEYDINGTIIGFFAVKASDGTIRTALNTCQVCNGSPYAFFEQQGDTFQCQNCGNLFSLDMIEQERGGCNPVPITKDEKTVNDTQIVIPMKYLEENVGRFSNWKKF